MKKFITMTLAATLALPSVGLAEPAQNPTIINTINHTPAASPQAVAAPAPIQARPRGKVIFKNIWAGIFAGSAAGFSAGLYGYGLSRNSDFDQVYLGFAYGMVTGALLGTGLGFMEFGEAVPLGTGANVGKYVAAGVGSGATIGLMVATIPYLKDKKSDRNFYYGSVGAGLGGLIGAGLGVLIAAIDSGDSEATAASGPKVRVGVMCEDLLRPYPPEVQAPELQIACRVVELKF